MTHAQNIVALVIAAAVTYYLVKKCPSSEPFTYATLNNYHPDSNDLLMLHPQNYCRGGPYMYSSNPERAKACQSYEGCGCGKGYNGAPIGFSYYDSNLTNV